MGTLGRTGCAYVHAAHEVVTPWCTLKAGHGQLPSRDGGQSIHMSVPHRRLESSAVYASKSSPEYHRHEGP